MAYSAAVVLVMIASPGDVDQERKLAREIIHEWNDVHSMKNSLVLMPVGWETHSFPELGGRPQGLINKNVLDKCDLLVAIFWTRIGTPTGKAESGTVEEIRKHVEAGKPAMVYFSTAPVAPQSLDADQYKQLTEFKEWCKTKGLIEEYQNIDEFSDKFRRQVQVIVRDNEFLREIVRANSSPPSGLELNVVGSSYPLLADSLPSPPILSTEAKSLLVETSKDQNGVILSFSTMGGHTISTNGINFVDSNDRRSVARWEAAVEQLQWMNLIVGKGNTNGVFQITQKGYELADQLSKDLKIQ